MMRLPGGAGQDKRILFDGDAANDPVPGRADDVLKKLQAIVSLPKATGEFALPASINVQSPVNGAFALTPKTPSKNAGNARQADESEDDIRGSGVILGFVRPSSVATPDS